MTQLADRLRDRVLALCSDECAGREAGSVEGARARQLIIDELTELGLAPIIQPVPGCRGANVIVRFAADQGRAVLLGAHYDHLGRGAGRDAYWGADDNAAAVALVLELAHRLVATPPATEVILIFFDGEEPPHFLTDEMGAMRFVADPIVALDRIHTAIVLDLIGHAIGPDDAPAQIRNTLFVLGGEKTPGRTALVSAAATDGSGLEVRQLDLDLVPPLSDYEPLRRHGVPVLFLTCARWRHYHELTDTPDRLDYTKLAAITDFTATLLGHLVGASDGPGRYENRRVAHAASVAELLDMARLLAKSAPPAALAVAALEELASSPNNPLVAAEWTRLQQIIALLEQGLG